MADTKIFQARGMPLLWDEEIRLQATIEHLTIGRLVQKMFAFYMAQGGPEWELPISMERPPAHRRAGPRMMESAKESGTVVTDKKRAPSGAKTPKRRTMGPHERPTSRGKSGQ